MSKSAKIYPSLWYCLLSLPFFITGGTGFFLILTDGIQKATDPLTQVVVPGSVDLTFMAGTSYTVFLESNSVVNGKVYSTAGSIEGLECRVTAALQVASITLGAPSSSMNYSLGGRSGRSILEFTAPASGQYTFACDYGEGAEGPQVVLAVGTGFGAALAKTVLMSFGALAGGVLLGIGVILIVVIANIRAKKGLAYSSGA